MQSIRRTVLAVIATTLAVFIGSGPAFAGPAPLIEPAPAPAGSSGGGSTPSSSSDGFLDTWLQVSVAVMLAVAVLAIAAYGVSRLRHHAPSAA